MSLPSINACLNIVTCLLLWGGWVQIRRGHERGHRVCMGLALATSAVFLGCYLFHHAQAGSTPFSGTGWIRSLYFGILITHSILAAIVPPLAITAAYLGIKDRRRRHRQLVKWLFPIWIYVSITGVIIYLMLYQLF